MHTTTKEMCIFRSISRMPQKKMWKRKSHKSGRIRQWGIRQYVRSYITSTRRHVPFGRRQHDDVDWRRLRWRRRREHKIRIYHKMRFIVRHRYLYIHFSDPDWSLLSGNLSWFVCMCCCWCCELLQIHSRKIALFKVDKWSPWLVTRSFWVSWKFCVHLLHYATQHAHTVTRILWHTHTLSSRSVCA